MATNEGMTRRGFLCGAATVTAAAVGPRLVGAASTAPVAGEAEIGAAASGRHELETWDNRFTLWG
jgi:hypothetical protein